MMYLLGVFLLVLSILLDEGSTLIAILRGLGPLETNIIYIRYGVTATISIIILGYTLLIFFWGWIIKMQKLAWKTNSNYKHFFDISVFLICFILMFITVTKVYAAYTNTGLVLQSMHPENKAQLYDAVKYAENLKETNHTEYVTLSTNTYLKGTYHGLNYGLVIFVVLCAFILFKIGNKIVPWQYG